MVAIAFDGKVLIQDASCPSSAFSRLRRQSHDASQSASQATPTMTLKPQALTGTAVDADQPERARLVAVTTTRRVEPTSAAETV